MKTIRLGPFRQRYTFSKETEWDDMGHNIISHIIVSYRTNGVSSIQFGYVTNGALVMSEKYGSSHVGDSSRIVRLKHESEFVTGMSGEMQSGYITSLTIHTNQRQHEVLHLPRASSVYRIHEFSKIELHSGILEPSEFGGFFGTYNDTKLISIGFYVRLVLPDVKMIKKEGD